MDGNELVLVCPSEDMEEEILRYKEEHFACGDTGTKRNTLPAVICRFMEAAVWHTMTDTMNG